MTKSSFGHITKACRDCRFNSNDGVSLDTCVRDQVLEFESNPPPDKPDYVRGGVIKTTLAFVLKGDCQATREDVGKCGPEGKWFEWKPKKDLAIAEFRRQWNENEAGF